MDDKTILFGLHELEGVGWKTILKLISHPDGLKSVAGFTEKQLINMQVRPQQARHIVALNEEALKQKLKEYEVRQIQVITVYDREYPTILKETAEPPWVLYCKGNLSLFDQPLLGMVGTRNPTAYGKKVAEDLSAALSAAGFGIVSGMARGIDTCSHLGALKGRGSTIAVLGCPVDQVYPRENTLLYKDIAKHGLIVSEYPSGTQIRPGMFPQRNRIIAGLSLGVVVVEAAEGSGSLITSDYALEESRDVFSVPGPITSPKSVGVLRLIKQGSKMITCAEDIIEEYTHIIPKSEWGQFSLSKSDVKLSKDELEIIRILSNEMMTIDDLIEHSQFTFGHLHSVLLSLLMKKQIIQLPGSAYIRS